MVQRFVETCVDYDVAHFVNLVGDSNSSTLTATLRKEN